MATPEEIGSLRLLIAEATDTHYTDESLSSRIDASSDLNSLAYTIWGEKAARYSALVDITEGGSSRKNSNLQANALTMAKHFAELAASGGQAPVSGTRIKRLKR